MIPPAQLSAVTVLYESAEVIEGWLESVPADVEVIVVDNASSDGGAARAAAVRPDARIIRSERNLGFGGGCNLGWRASTRPFVAFVNPDVRLRESTLATLASRCAREPHSMVGPVMLDGSGIPRRCKREPSVLSDFLGLLPAAARWAPPGWDGKLERSDPLHTRGGEVATVEGACFVIARADLEAIGGFDEDFFLYYEEESIALRVRRQLNGAAVYEPGAVAEHIGATSTAKVSALARHHFHRSRAIYYRKRDGVLRGRLEVLLLAVGVALSTPAAALNTLLRRGRPTTLSDRWGVLRGLAAGATARLGQRF
jgi:GT2 family glycosyltransferase